jgi:aryl-alcohol dehydrogenase-like predicted oxidoreductase
MSRTGHITGYWLAYARFPLSLAAEVVLSDLVSHVRLARSPATLAIPGTSSGVHLAENIAAADLRLTEDDIAQLDKLA